MQIYWRSLDHCLVQWQNFAAGHMASHLPLRNSRWSNSVVNIYMFIVYLCCFDNVDSKKWWSEGKPLLQTSGLLHSTQTSQNNFNVILFDNHVKRNNYPLKYRDAFLLNRKQLSLKKMFRHCLFSVCFSVFFHYVWTNDRRKEQLISRGSENKQVCIQESVSVCTETGSLSLRSRSGGSALSSEVLMWRSLRVMWPPEDNRAAERDRLEHVWWRLMETWLTSVISLQGQWQHWKPCVPWGWVSFSHIIHFLITYISPFYYYRI